MACQDAAAEPSNVCSRKLRRSYSCRVSRPAGASGNSRPELEGTNDCLKEAYTSLILESGYTAGKWCALASHTLITGAKSPCN